MINIAPPAVSRNRTAWAEPKSVNAINSNYKFISPNKHLLLLLIDRTHKLSNYLNMIGNINTMTAAHLEHLA
ncbi:MAG TPA: hypothetical protein V6D33_15745 [Cyanophyceae cyanobacterium]